MGEAALGRPIGNTDLIYFTAGRPGVGRSRS